MLPRTKISSLVILILVLVCSFSGSYGISSKSTVNVHINPHSKVAVAVPGIGRKLLRSGVDVLDYHDPGANQGHDPGKGKGGPH